MSSVQLVCLHDMMCRAENPEILREQTLHRNDQ